MPGSCQLTTQISPPTAGVCSQADTAKSHKEAERGQEPQELCTAKPRQEEPGL